MQTLNYNQTQFLTSAASIDQCPADSGTEVAFCGRSNAGKSSAINTITQQNRLAKTSKTPGRTQLLNFFTIDTPDHRLVDLPGYGFAKVPVAIKVRWEKALHTYFTTRASLKGLILLMDIRHPLTPSDEQMLEWTYSLKLPTHILLTKADKLKRGAAHNTLLQVQKALLDYDSLVSVQLFSSLARLGVEDARQQLDTWLLQ